mmetsp:Transcript_15176/g.38069  ORF Transcript_15176/g.38069 Transcript_15176/m.38069 type:complete len:145 (-) Transcript_15176:157-591(-)
MRLKQMDVKSAFTQVEVDEGEPIFIRPLRGLENPDDRSSVIQLVNHLYGHPLANAAWSRRWKEIMLAYGFEIVDRDQCVFRKAVGDASRTKLIKILPHVASEDFLHYCCHGKPHQPCAAHHAACSTLPAPHGHQGRCRRPSIDQ